MFIISQLLWVTEQYYNCVISSVSHRIWEQFTGLSVRIPSLAIVIWRLDRMENPLPTSLSGYWQEATGQLVSPSEWARMRIRAGKQEARWPDAFALEWPTITFAPSYWSHRQSLIQCGRQLQKPWTLGGRDRSGLSWRLAAKNTFFVLKKILFIYLAAWGLGCST